MRDRREVLVQPILLLVFCCLTPLLGQGSEGMITGRVVDATQAVVPGGEVSLTNEATGITRVRVTNDLGEYTFTNVPPGIYTLSVSLPGFKTTVIRNVVVFVNQTVRVDVRLEVGEVSATVEVESSTPVVQSEASSVGNVVDGKQLEAMPLDGRGDLFRLLSLAPGVQRGAANPMIAGGDWWGAANMTVDGVSNNDVGNERILGPIPSLDAIAEFKVVANMAPAEFGRGSAQIVVVTKSGTNEFHGSLFAFNRNRALPAKDFFATSLPKPPFNRNEFGGTFGGPIVRNRTFFFGSYEGLRFRSPSTHVVAMPTERLKQGDFTGLPSIRDPFTGQPFANNQIPPERISRVSRDLLAFASTPNLPGTGPAGLGNNFVVNVPRRENMDRYSLRVDHHLSSSDRITGRFYLVDNGPFVAPLGGGTDKFGNWGGFGIATRNVSGSYLRVFSPNTTNEFRFGFNQEENFRTPQNPDLDPRQLIPGLIPPVPGLGGLPTVQITGFRGFSDAPGSGDIKRNYQVYDNFSWLAQNHTVKVGFEYQAPFARNFQNPPPARGLFVFDGRYTGHPFADFLLGYASATARVSKNVEASPRNHRFAFFIQDDWKVTPQLTVNWGLRYEYDTLFKNDPGEMSNFYPDLRAVVVLKGDPDPRLMQALPIVRGQEVGLGADNYARKDRNNFGPRLGFAYRPFGSSQFVLRAGYGVFYNVDPAYLWPFQLSLNPPFRVSETFEPAPGPIPTLTFASPFPGSGTIPRNPALSAIARDRQTPYQQQWNFTLEYELFADTAVRATYLGNTAVHLPRRFPLNEPPPAPGPVQPRRPHQPWGPITYLENGRTNVTHQLQLALTRRYSRGLAFGVEHQWTKALGEQAFGFELMDPRNARLDRGNLDFIRRHVLKVNYIYDLPFGRGQRFLSGAGGVADTLLSGWQLAGIVDLMTGLPYSVTFTSTVLGWPSGRADLVGNPKVNNPTIQRYFNPDAFAVPAPFTFGNSARNFLFGPAFRNWDLALYKNTVLNEKVRLQFRAEFFNVLNHPNFGNPAGNISVPSQVGRISSTAGPPRNIQFALKLLF